MKQKIALLWLACIIACLTSACSGSPDMRTAKQAELQNDYKTSVDHYQRLAEFGLPEAQVELGKYYLNGKGVEKDPKKALALFEQASQKKSNPQTRNYIVRTQSQLGTMAVNGKSSIPPAKGIALLQQAAEAGDARAMFELGAAYEKGSGVPRNAQLALEYYKRAGAKGYGRADYNRAMLYEKGELVQQDLPQAINLYKVAAAKDYPRANLNLGRLYEKGVGVEQNLQLAEAYYHQAEKENVSAANDLKRLQKN